MDLMVESWVQNPDARGLRTLTGGHLENPRMAGILGLNPGVEAKDALAPVQSPLWSRVERPG